MTPADNTPNFDAMTPEEIMAWMESLARRQGADAEQFTTSADMVVAEIDPNSVVIDEPGYVPSEGKAKKEYQERQKATAAGTPPAPAPQPAKPAAAPPPPPQETFVQPAASIAPPQETFTPPPPETFAPPPVQKPAASAPPPVEPAAEPAGMSWLESLAADQGVSFPDLSSLGAELSAAAETPPPAESGVNPIDWLEGMAQESAPPVLPSLEAAGDDQMNWLESLARKQGADSEEFMTPANLDIPPQESLSLDGPGYTPYSVDSIGTSAPKTPEPAAPPPARDVQPGQMDDPAAWLDSLASSQGFDSESVQTQAAPQAERKLSDDEIGAALKRGEVVPHEQMEAWMNRQLEIGSQREEPEELTAFDPDAPAIPAELPDWLLEQVGQQSDVPAEPRATKAPLSDEITEPPAVQDMPDWLKAEQPSAELDLDSIFVPDAPAPAPAAPAAAPTIQMDIDSDDPWVEAFDYEHEQGQIDIEKVPDWYVQAVNDPNRAAQVEAQSQGIELEDAPLAPETELAPGEPEVLPDWLQGITGEQAPAAADVPDWLMQAAPAEVPAVQDVPDWLKDVDVSTGEVPGWLTDTLGTGEHVITPAPAPVEPAASIVPAARPAPAPLPQRIQIDAGATYQNARAKINSNDLNGALQDYELLVRANAMVSEAVTDLTRLADMHKNNSSVLRVLGDGLMRQGNLQAALDTYRKALNQL